MILKRYAGRLACAVLISLLLPLTPARTCAQNDLTIIPVDRIMWAVKRANVRSGLGTTFAKVGLLDVGEQVRVTGVGARGEWLRIERPQGRSAFVYAPLLAAAPPQDARAPAGRQILTYTNARYAGEVSSGKPHGLGTAIWHNGNHYEGEWRDGQRHGSGIFTWTDGSRYEGRYVNGKPSGQGKYSWPDGAHYQGDFVDGKRTGHGRYVKASGEVVEGEWKDNKLVRRSELPPAPK